MSNVNVLKKNVKIRQKRTTAPPTTTTKAGGRQKQQPKVVTFIKNNPFKTFLEANVEELDDVLEGYLATKMAAKHTELERVRLITTMRKIKSTIPFSLIKEFFQFVVDTNQGSTLANINLEQTLIDFKQQLHVAVTIDEMKAFIVKRLANSITSPPPIRRKQHIAPVILPPPQQTTTTKRILKYNHKYLTSLTKSELVQLARENGIRKSAGKDRQVIIRLLLEITQDIDVPRQKITYDREIPNVCESEYKNAPWVNTESLIKGMAINTLIIERVYPQYKQYATNYEVVPNWFRVRSTWYTLSCNNMRKFVPNAVGYFTIDDDVIVETEELFKKSQEFKPQYMTKRDLLKAYNQTENVDDDDNDSDDYSIDFPDCNDDDGTDDLQQQCRRSSSDDDNKQIVEQKKNAELAPGLMFDLQMFLLETTFKCDKCNAAVPVPPKYKTIHGDKRVKFCSSNCFDAFQLK